MSQMDAFVEIGDLNSVIGEQWLNSSAIDTYAWFLEESIQHKIEGFYYIPTYGIQFIGSEWKTPEIVKRHMSQSVSDKRNIQTVAVIINVVNHWILIVARSKSQEIEIIDTLPPISNEEVVDSAVSRLIKDYLEVVFGVVNWKIEPVPDISKQSDSHSCGAAALFYLEKVIRGMNLAGCHPLLYKSYRSTIIRKILCRIPEGKKLLNSKNKFTDFLKEQDEYFKPLKLKTSTEFKCPDCGKLFASRKYMMEKHCGNSACRRALGYDIQRGSRRSDRIRGNGDGDGNGGGDIIRLGLGP